MVFSMSALHGNTVTQCPQDTQLDSPIGTPPSPNTRGWGVFPANGERLIHLKVLTRSHAAPAEDALIGIVTIERIAAIDLVRLFLKRIMLVLDSEQFRGVVHGAVAVVVVAYRAIELVIAKNPVEGLGACGLSASGGSGNIHPRGNHGPARADQFAG